MRRNSRLEASSAALNRRISSETPHKRSGIAPGSSAFQASASEQC